MPFERFPNEVESPVEGLETFSNEVESISEESGTFPYVVGCPERTTGGHPQEIPRGMTGLQASLRKREKAV
jgi:hypothetical protein